MKLRLAVGIVFMMSRDRSDVHGTFPEWQKGRACLGSCAGRTKLHHKSALQGDVLHSGSQEQRRVHPLAWEGLRGPERAYT